ncbi:MAG TPA: response regulator transcription factor [Pelagibacterium sp.]|uniref:response regulator transcription factor n=1 Tax=Pelagibacterium sp. TaxID=1967288 RepID=UPI002CEDE02A|nr:response regulator transcription factor [Pelagibacterium sp.]HWJ87342.1 response regulator transcription factor [Pelagibacterium sp.]
MRLLLVEDEPEMASMITAALKRHDMIVDLAPNLAIAREAIQSASYDMVVLDRHLPDGEGLTFISYLRAETGGVPVMVLSAYGSTQQRIEGLDVGADDYLAKPFSIDELIARIRALRRRPVAMIDQLVSLGDLTYDVANREASVRGSVLGLPRRERLVLEALIQRAGRSVTRAVLEESVFGFDDEIASNSLDAHISRLRRKLTEAGAGVEIHTIRGIGYLIRQSA